MLRKSVYLLVALTLFASGCQASPITATSQSSNVVQSSPAFIETPQETSTSEAISYSWRGTSLTLPIDLPTSPNEANVYLGKPDAPVTIEDTRALADQFGMQGKIQTASSGIPGFLVVDGNRRLQVQSDYHFIYYPSHFNYWISDTANQQPVDADALIAAFMQEFGFDQDYIVKYSRPYSAYFALPLSPDGFQMRFPHFAASGFMFSFDQNGIVSVDANLLRYESLGAYGIISAEEALQKLLAPDPKYGTLEGGISSPSDAPQAWIRSYPADETITIYGYMNSLPSAEGGDPLVSLDGYTVTGNTASVPAEMPDTFVKASGYFHSKDGTDVFVLDSWEGHAAQEGWIGTLENQGDEVVLVTSDHGSLLMPDVPADVPLPLEDVYALGVVTVGDTFEWNAFDLRMVNGGSGGGGGGGLGFYDVNLTGTPMALPTLASPMQLQPKVGEQLVGLRGFVSVTLYNQPDGSQRAEYFLSFVSSEAQQFSSMIRLEGDGLEALQANHNRPVDIWGTVTGNEQNGVAIVDIDRFEIPFPDLQFQIFRGKQQAIQVEGKPALLFTTSDGQRYLQLAGGGFLDSSLIGYEGDDVLLEGLIFPEETVAGYATVHVFSASVTVDSGNASIQMEITADQPYVSEEPLPQEAYQVPAAAIDAVELVYLIPYQSYSLPNTDFYIQPMWLFSGHYNTGDVFEVFVQALQPEFLSPEIVTVEPPG